MDGPCQCYSWIIFKSLFLLNCAEWVGGGWEETSEIPCFVLIFLQAGQNISFSLPSRLVLQFSRKKEKKKKLLLYRDIFLWNKGLYRGGERHNVNFFFIIVVNGSGRFSFFVNVIKCINMVSILKGGEGKNDCKYVFYT